MQGNWSEHGTTFALNKSQRTKEKKIRRQRGKERKEGLVSEILTTKWGVEQRKKFLCLLRIHL